MTLNCAQVLAPAIRAHLSGGDDQVKRFAKLQTADLFAAADASLESIKHQAAAQDDAQLSENSDRSQKST